MLFFDLEFYVPPADRLRKSQEDIPGSLYYNPTIESHLLLGGYFVAFDFKAYKTWIKANRQTSIPTLEFLSVSKQFVRKEAGFWVWDYNMDEGLMLSAIIEFFKEEWEWQQANTFRILNKRVQDIVTCGISIARVDLPALYVRSTKKTSIPVSYLYDLLMKTKAIDLSNVACSLFPNDWSFYPKTANEIQSQILPNSKRKPSGKEVWDFYDNSEFELIEDRCYHEVHEMLGFYYGLSIHP